VSLSIITSYFDPDRKRELTWSRSGTFISAHRCHQFSSATIWRHVISSLLGQKRHQMERTFFEWDGGTTRTSIRADISTTVERGRDEGFTTDRKMWVHFTIYFVIEFISVFFLYTESVYAVHLFMIMSNWWSQWELFLCTCWARFGPVLVTPDQRVSPLTSISRKI
jgi:hypothetical protein